MLKLCYQTKQFRKCKARGTAVNICKDILVTLQFNPSRYASNVFGIYLF